ncbi:hypothetical protein NH340_JMT08905 [Sarcoptes scabiei]|nr:hypothetical protein NH340_JMT08905 [Sarcoptes scabiei]
MWCQVQTTPSINGEGCPLVRSKHAMSLATDGRIYLYGGKSLLNQTLRDLWRFDTDQNRWELVSSKAITTVPTTVQSNDFVRCSLPEPNSSNRQTEASLTMLGSSQSCHTSSSAILESNDFINPDFPNESSSPPPLQEHTIVSYDNKLYIFGGEIGYATDETPLWIYDLKRCVWRKFSTEYRLANRLNASISSRPLGRRGHSAVVYRNLMCIFGGYQDIKGSTSEIWYFDLDTEEWYLEGNNFRKEASPSVRHGHSAVVYQESMFIYGGMSNLNIKGDFWSWNFELKQWNRIKTNKNPGILAFHSAIVVLDSMFVYGGERSNGNHVNDLWRFRFANQTWEHIEIKGIAPSCRTRHVAIANPFLKELESSLSFRNGTKQNVWYRSESNLKSNNIVGDDVDDQREKESTSSFEEISSQTFPDQSIRETSFVAATKEKTNQQIKSISMCFNQPPQPPPRSKTITIEQISRKHDQSRNVDCEEVNEKKIDRNNQCNSITIDNLLKELDAIESINKKTESIDQNFSSEREFCENYSDKENRENQRDCSENIKNIDVNVENVGTECEKNKLLLNEITNTVTKVRMRSRRARDREQKPHRPYSDFYAVNERNKQSSLFKTTAETITSPSTNKDDFGLDELDNDEIRFKRRSIQESMSYYSLCFSTPPSHAKQLSIAPGMIDFENDSLRKASKDVMFETGKISMSDINELNVINETKNSSESLLDRSVDRSNFIESDLIEKNLVHSRTKTAKPRIDSSSLELEFIKSSSLFNYDSIRKDQTYDSYHLTIDISPDFEKELKFSTDSTPLNNHLGSLSSMDQYESDTSRTLAHLDMLEDYLEPEDMLEIITESQNEEEIITRSLMKMKSIPRTPGMNRKILDGNQIKSVDIDKNADYDDSDQRTDETDQQQSSITATKKTPPLSSLSAASVSNSSSGYQSLISSSGGDSNFIGNGSFDTISSQSLSGSSSFINQHQCRQQHYQNQNEYSISAQKLVSKLNDSLLNFDIPSDNHHQQELNELKCSSAQLTNQKRLRGFLFNYISRYGQHHRQPNREPEIIKEVIDEVQYASQTISSPTTLTMKRSGNSKINSLNIPIKSETIIKEHFSNHNYHHCLNDHRNQTDCKTSLANEKLIRIKQKQNPIFCLYVFGGKEDCITGVLNKKSMTVWKYYL